MLLPKIVFLQNLEEHLFCDPGQRFERTATDDKAADGEQRCGDRSEWQTEHDAPTARHCKEKDRLWIRNGDLELNWSVQINSKHRMIRFVSIKKVFELALKYRHLNILNENQTDSRSTNKVKRGKVGK